jgi:very-short-patch-repair endonuclease
VSSDDKKTRLAQSLRKRIIPAEKLLWKALRNRALAGFKFRRQHPIGPYIVDFACVECRLAIEVDGQSHLIAKTHDKERVHFIAAAGWHVIRFWNTEIYEDMDPVKEAVYRECVCRGKRG